MRFEAENIRKPTGSLDFYPTPDGATESLIQMERFDKTILEPANGQGHLSSILEAAGYSVVKRDVQTGHDFLKCQDKFGSVVTNPPFNLANQFAIKCKEVAENKFALLLRLAFLEGQRRYEFFQDDKFPLSRVLVFSKRIRFYAGNIGDNKGGMIPYAWFVWARAHKGRPSIDWIKPNKT